MYEITKEQEAELARCRKHVADMRRECELLAAPHLRRITELESLRRHKVECYSEWAKFANTLRNDTTPE